jgi:hypothetical protein
LLKPFSLYPNSKKILDNFLKISYTMSEIKEDFKNLDTQEVRYSYDEKNNVSFGHMVPICNDRAISNSFSPNTYVTLSYTRN